jgi:hypothetical protein
MIGMNILLVIFIFLFGVIGYVRGGTKEALVTAAMILALYIIIIFEKYIPFIRDMAAQSGGSILTFRLIVIGVLLFFGYQTPNHPKAAAGDRFEKEGQPEFILGIIFGALNGYLIFGTVWYYLNNNGHPFPIIANPTGTDAASIARQFIPYLPPHWMGEPVIYFAVAVPLFILLAIFI